MSLLSKVKSAYLIQFSLVWAILVWAVVTSIVIHAPIARAVLCMAGGLILFWILIGGFLAYRYRDPIKQAVQSLRWSWKLKFVLFATLLALIEEAVTTTMTNLAPRFGVKIGEAYITASTNYLDVVLGHSVIVFIPMFIGWSWVLSRFAFSPNEVLLLFGLTGVLAESGTFGWQNLGSGGFWILVYGLMVYLPAYSLPEERATRKPRIRHYFLAVFLPFLCVIPVAGIVSYLHPIKIHFPPIAQ